MSGVGVISVQERWSRVFCALLLATLGACTERGGAGSDLLEEQVPEAERYGGTLVIGIPSDIADVNPLTRQTAVAGDIIKDVLQLPLVGYDKQLQPVPRLAKSWELNEAAGTLTFRLRDDVFWHDGVRTTAYDMHFAYERARDPLTAYPGLSMLEPYGDAEVVDSFTWRVRTPPHAEFLDVWTIFPPLPRHLLEAVPPEAMGRHPFSHSAPVGNGPFRFVERRLGRHRALVDPPGEEVSTMPMVSAAFEGGMAMFAARAPRSARGHPLLEGRDTYV